jgi:predicted flap endonuclease-1-like 5' DNA nuclease
MDSLGCCFIWLLVGALLGCLLCYWFCKRCKSKNISTPPAAKVADVPAAVAPVEKAQPKPKAPATAKPKTVAKAKTAPAKKVVAGTIDLAAAKAAGIAIKNADDLTVIEGIGPKINELFKENGLKTFAQVGDATATQMRAILDKGGARYRMANPSTWAKQAKLAANNKWAELKKLQDELSGGKKK